MVFENSIVHLRFDCTEQKRKRGRTGSTVKHIQNLALERIGSEWFLDEIGAWFQQVARQGRGHPLMASPSLSAG
jgi:hypothetical protein